MPRFAAGGTPDGSLEAIAGEVAPELFRHKGRNYIVSNPDPGVHITMEPGDFVLPRGKRVEDLPRLRGEGLCPGWPMVAHTAPFQLELAMPPTEFTLPAAYCSL